MPRSDCSTLSEVNPNFKKILFQSFSENLVVGQYIIKNALEMILRGN